MKQETLEEAAQHYTDNWETITGLDYEECVPIEISKIDFIAGAKWQQERSYSEEEVLSILFKYGYNLLDKDAPFTGNTTDEWFEQFKKK